MIEINASGKMLMVFLVSVTGFHRFEHQMDDTYFANDSSFMEAGSGRRSAMGDGSGSTME